LHATNANQTLDRVLNFFPSDAHNQILMDLSLNLNAIMAQRLVVSADGTRIVATEVLVNTPYISQLIRDGNFYDIKQVMEKGADVGMQTFDQSLYMLFKAGKIDLRTALTNADSSSDLEWRINFGGGVKDMNAKEANQDTLQFPSTK
jgi:twitching motility protein PilU